MVNPKAENTQRKILSAAINVFSQKGFSAATTSEIAREAQVAEGTIFRYFPTKEKLLHSVILQGMDLFESVLFSSLDTALEKNKDKPVKEIYKAIFRDRAAFTKHRSPLLKVIMNEAILNPEIRELLIDRVFKRVVNTSISVLEYGKKSGEIRDINAFIASRSIVSMVTFMNLQRQLMPGENQTASIEEEIDIMLDIIFNGIVRGSC